MKARRRIHQLPRVDLTPFVSIALLLITFFIWMKRIQQPVVLSGYIHFNCKCEYDEYLGATLFLLDQNRVGLLRYGPARESADYLETDYSVSGLRTQLANIAQANQTKRAIVLIAPTPQSTVKNLVDVIDELTINGKVLYTLGYEITDGENQLLASYRHYRNENPYRPAFFRVLPRNQRGQPLYPYTSESKAK